MDGMALVDGFGNTSNTPFQVKSMDSRSMIRSRALRGREHRTQGRCREATSVGSNWTLGSASIITGFLVIVIVATAAPLHCSALVTSRQLGARHKSQHDNNHPYLPNNQQPPSRTSRSSRGNSQNFMRLQVAKTGGKMIDTEEQFSEIVLAKDVPRPVMVFFSAPW